MKILNLMSAVLASSLLLIGCGGGNTLTGPPGGSSSSSGGGSTVATVTVSSSTPTIAADGSTTATITAVARDANNAFVANASVTFGSSAGGVAIVSGTTDTNGAGRATLSASGAPAGTAIDVSAKVGTITGHTTVNVVAIQQTLTLSTTLPQVPSNSNKPATISALLRDANNNVLPNVVIHFSSTSGAITPVQTLLGGSSLPAIAAGTTDANGVATAALTAGNDPTNRSITVTASGGSAPAATIAVAVTGTQLVVSGQPSLVSGSSSPYTALLTDSAGVGIPGASVVFASASGNALSIKTGTTDFSGHVTVQLTASVAGNDTLSATSLGLTATQAIAVSNQSFTIVPPVLGTLIPLDTVPPTNTPPLIKVVWTSNGAPVVNTAVAFATTRGSILSATPPYAVLPAPTVNTDATGTATVAVASSLAGPAIVSATGTGVSAQLPVTFVAQVPASIAVQASPATVAINGSSVIEAVVRDANNNLVEGATVDFNLTVDPTGGQLSVPSAVTNLQGRAQTIFTASATTSAANGITVTASVQGSSVSNIATLSVGGQTVFLSLGTGNKINSPNTAEYEQDWAVQALDSHGGAVATQTITVQILPLYYFKGFRYFVSPVWVTVNSIPNCPYGTGTGSCLDPLVYVPKNYTFVPNGTQCANEDVGWTGIFVSSEDLNQNGKLDPGNVASVTAANSGVTDASGTVLLAVTWPQDHSYYVGVRLIATTTVQGTQSSTSADFLLPGLASDFNNPANEPPGPVSPYGSQASPVGDCSNKK